MVDEIARQALGRARDHLLGLQHAEGDKGWWQGELQTNVTMDAEDLLLREFLGLHDDAVIAAAARWIRSQQREDGTWANFYGGPGDLSTTVEAYLALRLAGDEPGAPHMKLACDWIIDQGGVEATRVFTRIWLALSGLWSWDDLPVIPPELIYLPSWFPLNIYDWGCWARQTIVALAVVQSFRPSRPLGLSIDELRTGGPHGRAPRPSRSFDARPLAGSRTPTAPPARTPFDPWSRFFAALDKTLHLYRPVKSVRRAALRRCAEWIITRQERDGCWGGIQPPWVYSLMALNLLGYDISHPVMAKGVAGLDRFTITEDTPDGTVRRLEACQSPVWDTILTMTALADAGLPADDPFLVRAARWVRDEEIRGPGDWQVRRPGVAPGGWAFEFDNDNYADTDDTAEVVLALRRVAPRDQAAIDRGLAWLAGMQSRDGGWGAFDADNTRKLVNKLPFCDFGAVVPALIAAGVRPDKPAIRRAVAWLERCQNPDGGWGEDLRSYDDQALAGQGHSTASQTAWALLALLAAGERDSTATQRGIRWLAETQRADGSWDEPWFTGTGFPGDFYINYHLYRLAFPVSALGRYINGGTA
jgi:squalene-hopene/tetraprenyl-beta-curcumene cyclase